LLHIWDDVLFHVNKNKNNNVINYYIMLKYWGYFSLKR